MLKVCLSTAASAQEMRRGMRERQRVRDRPSQHRDKDVVVVVVAESPRIHRSRYGQLQHLKRITQTIASQKVYVRKGAKADFKRRRNDHPNQVTKDIVSSDAPRRVLLPRYPWWVQGCRGAHWPAIDDRCSSICMQSADGTVLLLHRDEQKFVTPA
jgi:hypothetical protein